MLFLEAGGGIYMEYGQTSDRSGYRAIVLVLKKGNPPKIIDPNQEIQLLLGPNGPLDMDPPLLSSFKSKWLYNFYYATWLNSILRHILHLIL